MGVFNTCIIMVLSEGRTRLEDLKKEVKAILEPEGWWEKVLGFDPKRINELLTDKTVSPEIKKKIKSLKRVVSSYPQLRLKKRAEEEE